MKIGRRSASFSFSFLRVNIRPSKIVLRRSPKKKVFKNFFPAINKISATQKILLFSSREQSNFRGLEAKDLTFEAEDMTFEAVVYIPEVDSSRTHFDVLGLEGHVLGLKSSKIGLFSARGQQYFLSC